MDQAQGVLDPLFSDTQHPVESPVAPVVFPEGDERFYSTSEVAELFFRKSTQWLHWGSKAKGKNGKPVVSVFTYKNGEPIEPVYVGKGRIRRYSLPIIHEMALACYRRGTLKEEELERVLARIKKAEMTPLGEMVSFPREDESPSTEAGSDSDTPPGE